MDVQSEDEFRTLPEDRAIIMNKQGTVTGYRKYKELSDDGESEGSTSDDRDDLRVRSRRSLEQSDLDGD